MVLCISVEVDRTRADTQKKQMMQLFTKFSLGWMTIYLELIISLQINLWWKDYC